MRKISSLQLSILILCLCITGALTYWTPEARIAQHGESLESVLGALPSWRKASNVPLSPIIVEELNLDDFIFQNYERSGDLVTLYIGYYFSGKKVGAAHDPQVCYPGQGWKLRNKEQKKYSLKNNMELNYSKIIAELEDKKEQIFYWFQVDDISTSGTFQQKLTLFKKKIFGQGEGNAFVRISTSLTDKSEEDAQKVLTGFIEDFYPLFHQYINKGT